jgi:hypothetical protein
MIQEDFKKLQETGQVEEVQEDKPQDQPKPQEKPLGEFDFSALLEQLKVVRKPVSTAPTFTPRGFLDQIQFYESGSTRRLYIYISPTWRYVTLT